MSPSPTRQINGTRPAPLKIHKDSHQIQKQPTSSTTTTNHHHNHRQPIIIYTHSPKVIHTEARDFMALVQKLTGLSRSPEDDNNDRKQPEQEPKGCGRAHEPFEHRDNIDAGASDQALGFDDSQQLTMPTSNSFLSEIPMFTPASTTSMDYFFLSPKSLYRYSSAVKPFHDFR